MKLAEALIMRADTQNKLHEMRMRLVDSSKVQEGETPPEDPQELLKECSSLLKEQTTLIQRINKTNSFTKIDNQNNLSDLITERDMLKQEISILTTLVDNSLIRQDRYSKSEIKFYSTIDIGATRKNIDKLSKEYRELDTKLQGLNWTTDLL